MSRKWAIVAVVFLAVLVLLPLSNLLGVPGDPHPVTPAAGRPGFEQASRLLQEKCLDCHTPEMARMPIYASLPVANGMIRRDIEEASGHWEVEKAHYAGEAPFAPLMLTRLALALEDGSMPPATYRLLHWSAGVGRADREALLAWVRAEMESWEGSREMADSLRAEPVRPLPLSVDVDPAKAALGERLFHDARLSGDGTVSCASCHALHKGGTDQARVSTGIRGQQGPINSPTVFNASYNRAQFWDGRARDLREQAEGPVTNPLEMGAAWDDVIARLRGDAALATEFAPIYPEGITVRSVTDAIAAFEATLVTANSRFDRYLRGDASAITPAELEGYALFKKTGCVACHAGPALGGDTFQMMGVKGDYFGMRGGPLTDADRGRYNATKKEEDLRRFKVPILRNVAVTQPYFHDGWAPDLETAVRVMAEVQRERELTGEEVASIRAFLLTLTGEYRGTPVDRIPEPV